jgi:hypothetical protein
MSRSWVQMPFGKHKGDSLGHIRDDYLMWLLGNVENMTDYLRDAIEAELQQRHVEEEKPSTAPVHPGVAAWRHAWRKVIFLAHPDRGGNEELCKILNNINDAMRLKRRPR